MNIETLRRHLFETLEALRDKKSPLELDRAKAIADVAQTIVNTAKVEVDYLRATGGRSAMNFIPAETRGLSRPPLKAADK